MDCCLNDFLGLEDVFEPQWRDILHGKKPPRKYVANYVSCKGDFASAPSLMDFVLHGFSYDEAVRMKKLLYIEQLKSALEYKRGEMLYTPLELEAFEASISERIRDYNESA